LLVAWVARLQIADTTQCSLPVLLQLRSNETILEIAGRVAPLGKGSTTLADFEVSGIPKSVFL
jgi:hypothetical protein